jgi:hypothetical protein
MKNPIAAVLCTLTLATGVVAQTPPRPAPTPIESLAPRPPLSPATLEKLARMKPIFDGRTLAGWIEAPVAPLRFSREDVISLPALVKKLTDKTDGVAAFIRSQLDEAGQAALTQPTSETTNERQTISALLRTINRLVSGNESLFEEARFQGVTLRPETTQLRAKNPRGNDLARLNRLLLEDAFPQELAQSPSTGWIVKDGALASTGAGRGVIYTESDYTHYRLVFQVRQLSGNHVPGILIFCERPLAGELGRDALGAVQFQVPNGGHWDYRPGFNKGGDHFTRPTRVGFNLNEWAQVEILVNAKTGAARMAVAQPAGTRAIENLVFADPAAGKAGPIALQMHNARLFDEFKDLRIELDPTEDRLLTVE